MRISDWSSDVCSSDLLCRRILSLLTEAPAVSDGTRPEPKPRTNLNNSDCSRIRPDHLEARPHGRRQRDLLDIFALPARRLRLHDRIHDRIQIGAQVLGRKARLDAPRLHVYRLFDLELPPTPPCKTER